MPDAVARRDPAAGEPPRPRGRLASSCAYVSRLTAGRSGWRAAARGSQASTSTRRQSSLPRMPVTWTAAGEYTDIRYELDRRRDREDHDQPPRGAQRLPARRRSSSCREAFDARAGRPDRRRHRPHRRGRHGVLLGRRPAHPRRRRLHRRRRRRPAGHRAPQRRSTCRSRCAGCPSRSSRWSPATRSAAATCCTSCCDLTIAADNARFGQTGPTRRLLRRRLRLRPARPPDRPEARQGGLVPLPPVRRADRRCEWGLVNTVVPLERLEEETVQWCREMLALSPLALRLLKASLQRGRGRPGRHPAARGRRHAALLHERRGPGGPRRLRREAPARLLEVPAAAVAR